jgi:hypothetical protein
MDGEVKARLQAIENMMVLALGEGVSLETLARHYDVAQMHLNKRTERGKSRDTPESILSASMMEMLELAIKHARAHQQSD